MSYRVWVLLVCFQRTATRKTSTGQMATIGSMSSTQNRNSCNLFPRPTSVPTYSAPKGPGKLSVTELRLRPKAVRELELSKKANLSGDWRSCATHLENVLAIDPQYSPAHDKLGTLS